MCILRFSAVEATTHGSTPPRIRSSIPRTDRFDHAPPADSTHPTDTHHMTFNPNPDTDLDEIDTRQLSLFSTEADDR